MAVNIGQGPLGLEANWKIGSFEINQDVGDLPRYKLDRITGFGALPEVEDQHVASRGRIGEVPYPIQGRGKTMVFEGRMQAGTLARLRVMRSDMLGALWNRKTEKMVRTIPNEEYADEGSAADGWYGHGRVTDLQMDEEQKFSAQRLPTGFQREFTITFRMGDPRFYLFGGEIEVAYGTSVTATNSGNAPTEPVIRIDEMTPGGTYDITNDESRRVRLVDVPDSTLDVDFYARTIRKTDGTDVSWVLHPGESNWWDEFQGTLYPGPTDITASDGAEIRVTFTPASW